MNKDQRLNRKLLFLFVFIVFQMSIAPVEAQEMIEPPFSATQYKFKNGLHVILSEEPSLPLVSVVVAYNVGSINEEPGKTGLAHLLEYLMFQGSENVRRMQHISIINRVGGEFNSTTTGDKTIFYQRVPSNQLVQVLWLESDRMKSLQINETNVEQTKQIILEEISLRKTDNPYLESFWRFDRLLYSDFAFGHPVIGSSDDVKNLTVRDVKNFYSTYYVPNNAVIAIVGNFDREKTLDDIRKYFESIPQGKDIPPAPMPTVPEKKSTVDSIVCPSAPSPGFHLGFRLAPPSSEAFYALAVVEYILLGGKSSRLYKRLIRRERLALDLRGEIEKKGDLARFKTFILNNNQFMVQRSKRAIFSEIHKLKTSFISEEELRKAKNMLRKDYINQYASSLQRALFLAETFLSRGVLLNPSEELKKYLAVTPNDIVGVTARYFDIDSVILDVKTK